MRKPLSRWIVALVLLASAGTALAFLVPAPTAEAIAGPGICTYYSNSSYTTVVGARGTGCCGAVIHWGVTSAFKRCEVLYCLDVLCPQTE